MLNEKIILIIKYIILGIVQGFTEPLPISSSGHIIIFDDLFNFSFNNIDFMIILNFASLLAIIFFYRAFILNLIKGFFLFLFKHNYLYKKEFLYIIYIIIATIPAAICGYFLKDLIDLYFSNTFTVCLFLLITSISLFIISNKQNNNNEITFKSCILMGFFQILGLFPGISRSGITSTIGVINKTNTEKAFRFSFMMYIPVSFGALFLSLNDLSSPNKFLSFEYFFSFIFCFIFTYFSLCFFRNFIIKKRIKFFAYYCLLISIFIFILKYLFF